MKKILSLILVVMFFSIARTAEASAIQQDDIPTQQSGAFEYYIYADEAHIVRCYDNMGGIVVFPDTIEGCAVTEISGDVFRTPEYPREEDYATYSEYERACAEHQSKFAVGGYYFKSFTSGQLNEVKSVILPVYITEIEAETFKDMQELESVVVPDGVWHIGESAFENCKALKEISLSATTIEDHAFDSCAALQTINFKKALDKLGDSVFAHCHELQDLVLESNQNEPIVIGELFASNIHSLDCDGHDKLKIKIYGDVISEYEGAEFFPPRFSNGMSRDVHIIAEYGSNAEFYALLDSGASFESLAGSSILKSYRFWSWMVLILLVLVAIVLVWFFKNRKQSVKTKESRITKNAERFTKRIKSDQEVKGQPTQTKEHTVGVACIFCGTENSSTARFCKQCGQSMAHK